MLIVRLDFETRSEKNLNPKAKDYVGVHAYAAHPSTSILCLRWRVGQDGENKLWRAHEGEPFSEELAELAKRARPGSGVVFKAFNAAFEKAIWWHLLTIARGIPYPENWQCSQAATAHRALPHSLDEAGAVLDLPVQKDKRGTYLIQRLCKQHKPSKKWPDGWVEDKELFEELYEYCGRDVDAEEAIDATLGPLPPREQAIWSLDQVINERGIKLDLDAIDAAIEVRDAISGELTDELCRITDNAVRTHNELANMHSYFKSIGLHYLPDLQADTIKAALKGWELPAKARRVLEIRQVLSKTSLNKLDAMKRWVSPDGRLRGALQYAGAGRTNRWAGRGPQPQNLPRPTYEKIAIDDLIGWINERVLTGRIDPETGSECDPMVLLTDALRGMFIAGEGKTLQVSDYSAIEGRGTAWVAGEEWKLRAFEQGIEIYCATAAKIFKRPITKKENPKERGIGKICELAFGYQGAVGAWRNFDSSDDYTDAEVAAFCRQWRQEHPATVAAWKNLELSAGMALDYGQAVQCGPVVFEPIVNHAGRWLTIILPGGRRMWYFNPRFEVEETPYGRRYHVTYEGRDNKRGGKWGTIAAYGGLWMENIVQALCRDIMVEGMFAVELAGYPLVLTVHDELVTEPDLCYGAQDHFDSLLSKPIEWLPGFPLAVAGWRGPRYHKD